jgi:hypothetical protein
VGGAYKILCRVTPSSKMKHLVTLPGISYWHAVGFLTGLVCSDFSSIR